MRTATGPGASERGESEDEPFIAGNTADGAVQVHSTPSSIGHTSTATCTSSHPHIASTSLSLHLHCATNTKPSTGCSAAVVCELGNPRHSRVARIP